MQVTRSEYLAALRSGIYDQTQGTLYRPLPCLANETDSGFCCLGVYCDLVDPLDWEQENHGGMFHTFAGSSVQLYGDSVAAFGETFGIEDRGIARDILTRLATMNDEEGYSFQEIANWLEFTLPAYVGELSEIQARRYTTA